MNGQDIRILVVEDHDLIQGMIVDRLQREIGLQVVGTTGDADEAVRLASTAQPDIAMLDIDLAGRTSLSAARQIMEQLPAIRLIFLSAFTYDRYIEEALAIRASAYISKQEGLDVIVAVLRDVAAGGRYYSRDVLHRLVIDKDGVRTTLDRSGIKALPLSRTRAATLTTREVEILRDIAQGLTKRDIAERLHISIKTIESHCDNLMAKLRIHDRVELARFAIREGLCEL